MGNLVGRSLKRDPTGKPHFFLRSIRTRCAKQLPTRIDALFHHVPKSSQLSPSRIAEQTQILIGVSPPSFAPSVSSPYLCPALHFCARTRFRTRCQTIVDYGGCPVPSYSQTLVAIGGISHCCTSAKYRSLVLPPSFDVAEARSAGRLSGKDPSFYKMRLRPPVNSRCMDEVLLLL